MTTPVLSIVTPAFNEGENLLRLHERIVAMDWTSLGMDFELLIVDNNRREPPSNNRRAPPAAF